MSATTSWGYRHPRFCTGVRIATATWNLVFGLVLFSQGHPWGLLLLVVSALVFWAAYGYARRYAR